MTPARYIARETATSIAINTALSAAFFALAFGVGRPVAVWGLRGFVADFAPQGFMIALMATLVPGALAARARRAGRLAPLPGRALLPRGLGRRALVVAPAGAALGCGLAGAAMAVSGAQQLAPALALAAKLGFGAGLAALVTPAGLRAALAA